MSTRLPPDDPITAPEGDDPALEPLAHWLAEGWIEPLDYHLGRMAVRGLDGRLGGRRGRDGLETPAASLGSNEAPPALAAVTMALVSRLTRLGHSCVDLEAWADRAIGPADAPWTTPSRSDWVAALEHMGITGLGDRLTPLICADERWLYLTRYWQHENRLAERLADRSRHLGAIPIDAREPGWSDRLKPLLGGDAALDAAQRIAVAIGLLRPIALIIGGPGTGKTTTVGRLLSALAVASPHRRIALAAPTGKAAVRLTSALDAARARLSQLGSSSDALPTGAVTVHRLLGPQAHRPGQRFRHHRGHPIPYDTVIVDEVSMVDLALMDHLVEALPETAQLILVGDPNQLAAVEVGSVLADLTQPGADWGEEVEAQVARLSGQSLEQVRAAAAPGPLPASTVALRTGHRFDGDSTLRELAESCLAGSVEGFLERVDDTTDERIHWEPIGDPRAALERIVQLAHPAYAALQREANRLPESGATLIELLGQFGILSARRHGMLGSQLINQRLTRTLAPPGWQSAWYRGRPIQIQRNDYEVDLFNGDLGLALTDPETRRVRVAFPGIGEAGVRLLPTVRLPAHESAYATTIHKSQGSEFTHVLVVLPPGSETLMTRELLYTAITRSRGQLTILADRAVLRVALRQTTARQSRLAERIAAHLGNTGVSGSADADRPPP
jgi:exodeoxyribonuclease V alpha subunit